MKILIDNGHGSDTAGKRSPDGVLREYEFARKVAASLVGELLRRGVDAELLVPEQQDVPLAERCRRANELDPKQTLLVSVHCNASGNGSEWKEASGWEVWTSPGQTEADRLADCLFSEAEKVLKGHKMRADWSDGDPDKEARFYILIHTACPAVLTENLFQDNRSDVSFLMSDEGIRSVVELHVRGICRYLGV